MNRFKNILYVAEPSVDQTSAIARAVALAENNQAELTLLWVDEKPNLGLFAEQQDPGEIETALCQRGLEKLEALAAPYRDSIPINLRARLGHPFLEVIRDVLRHGHDLVIKTALPDSGFRRHVFGSDDMHLLRKCPCPVWITRPVEKNNYKRVLAAVDFDPWEADPETDKLNRAILEITSSLALSDFAELHLIHVWNTMAELVVRMWGGQRVELDIASYVEHERLRHHQGMEALTVQLRQTLGAETYDYLNPRLHLPRGNAREIIPKLAAELDIDLVVMGTVARSGVQGFIIGNTAESILNRIQCSVLALKPESFVSPVTLP